MFATPRPCRVSAVTNVARNTLTRRAFQVGTAAATLSLTKGLSAMPAQRRTFTILHTNDLHSNLIGMAPASDYSPFTLNGDGTRGGFARLATLIGDRLKSGGQATIAIDGDESLVGWNLRP